MWLVFVVLDRACKLNSWHHNNDQKECFIFNLGYVIILTLQYSFFVLKEVSEHSEDWTVMDTRRDLKEFYQKYIQFYLWFRYGIWKDRTYHSTNLLIFCVVWITFVVVFVHRFSWFHNHTFCSMNKTKTQLAYVFRIVMHFSVFMVVDKQNLGSFSTIWQQETYFDVIEKIFFGRHKQIMKKKHLVGKTI